MCEQQISAYSGVAWPFSSDWDKDIRPVRADLERFVANAIDKHLPDLRYISREDFTKTAFPNLPSEAAPTDLRYIRLVLDSRMIRQRLEPINLRYIVHVGRHTEIETLHSWVMIGGYMAATAAGFSTWEKDTDVNAPVFELLNPKDTSRSDEHSEGTSWVAGLFPFVIGMPTSSDDVPAKPGPPFGTGRSHLPFQTKPIDMWSTYYEPGTTSEDRRTLLLCISTTEFSTDTCG